MNENIFGQKPIRFYRTSEEHGYMSNFSKHPVFIDGVIWPTTEHYYQAMKTFDPVRKEAIRQAPSPAKAAEMGRDTNYPIDPTWDVRKLEVMRKALWAKFTQHPDLKQKLIQTGRADLIEASPYDSYWGSGPKGFGENWLGLLLMGIRTTLDVSPIYL